ncbi:MAG: Rieske 2Fe-2S domain-containing protein [Gammaproteobacteria bacterium]|nr:Rieske 2Fe-2S domain-containing protein [Gammaproteobacteria bacterium]
MKASQTKRSDSSLLFPFPEGWYFVASLKSIVKEKLIQKTWLGIQIVVWCDNEGCICVAESVCPHMGSELGPEAGGQVRNGCLVCPFHGFEYDVCGQCVTTPFAPPPESAKLHVFETRELLGLVFAWWGTNGRPSQWHLPEDPPTGPDWGELEFRSMQFPGHPQETTENAVDMAHLRYVHGYSNVSRTASVSVKGACLESCFEFRRTQKIAGVMSFIFDVSAVAHVYGLGYSFVQIYERTLGMDARLWVLATPVDGTLIDLVLVGQLREMRKPKRPIIGMRFMPAGLRTRIMSKIIISVQKRDVLQDVVIWSRKHYRSRPQLCRSDGEIAVYRRYCEQFYPEHQDGYLSKRNLQSVQA